MPQNSQLKRHGFQGKPGENISGVYIESLAYRGAGVARINGHVIFVPSTVPGDLVEVRIVRQRNSYLEAQVKLLEAPSPDRIEPPCPYFERCGGCQWQHVSYPAQLNAKENILRQVLQRIGDIPAPPVIEVIASPRPLGYRRRILLHAIPGKRGARLGYVAAGTHRTEPVKICLLAKQGINDFLQRLALMLNRLPQPHELKRVEIMESGPKEVVLALSVKHNGAAARCLQKNLPLLSGLRGFRLKIPGSQSVTFGDARVKEEFSDYDVSLNITAGGFWQPNGDLNLKLVDLVVRWADLDDREEALDLFCGAGNFALPLARHGKFVHGWDADTLSIRDARRNARTNGFFNVDFREINLKRSEINIKPVDLIVMDPPRSGAAKLIPSISQLRPGRIVHLACDPTTGARDLKSLIGAGYRLDKIALMDFFPQTFHFETISLLTLNSGSPGR
jgi:23S rRNA (uracil1939-C5)-methyltransferase